jgi:hypothetical protein
MLEQWFRRRPRAELVLPCAGGLAGLVSFVGLRRPYVSFLFAATAGCWVCAMLARRRPTIARLLTGVLLFSHPERPAATNRLARVQAIALTLLLGVLMGPWWRQPPPFSPIYDDHEWTSLNLAVTRAKCGAASAVPRDVDVASQLSARADTARLPLADLATFTCSSIRPLVIGQNTLMLIEAATLRLNPRASLTTIGRVLIAIQMIGTGVFITALIVVGVPGAWCALLLMAVVTLTGSMIAQSAYAVYPLVVPSVLGLIGTVLLLPRTCSRTAEILIGASVGMAIGAIGNLRTDMFLICGAVTAVWLAGRSRSLRHFAGQGIAMTAGAVVFHLVCIRPIEQAQPQRLSGHPIMHPLVLGLAIPENAMAQRVGLRWDDTVGFDLAHAIQPGVHVLTPDYEAVLRRFYVQLWRQHPMEMLQLYRRKFAAAARSFVTDTTGIGFDGQVWRSLLRPLQAIGSNWAVPVLFAIGAGAGLARLRRWHASWVTALTLLMIAGGLNWLEAAIIFPHFTPSYFGVAFIAVVAGCLALYQLVLHIAWWPMNRPACPDRGTGAGRSSNSEFRVI